MARRPSRAKPAIEIEVADGLSPHSLWARCDDVRFAATATEVRIDGTDLAGRRVTVRLDPADLVAAFEAWRRAGAAR